MQDNSFIKLPNLKHFTFHLLPTLATIKYMKNVGMNLQNKLESLDLSFINHNVIPILARIKTLKQLSISADINNEENLINATHFV